jgi:putative drug exporter of the RND superfamily
MAAARSRRSSFPKIRPMWLFTVTFEMRSWHLLHRDLHWAVAPIAFIALIAVGADYNLLLALRIKQEAQAPDAGIKTGIIRAFGGTIAVGLLLDTLVVRALVTPSVVALLGRWFWWPRGMALAVTRE